MPNGLLRVATRARHSAAATRTSRLQARCTAEVDVRKMGNYWLKVTGDSIMLDSGIPAHMVNGQGRWRLHASDPPEMVYKYRQSDLETKLKTSDL